MTTYGAELETTISKVKKVPMSSEVNRVMTSFSVATITMDYQVTVPQLMTGSMEEMEVISSSVRKSQQKPSSLVERVMTTSAAVTLQLIPRSGVATAQTSFNQEKHTQST